MHGRHAAFALAVLAAAALAAASAAAAANPQHVHLSFSGTETQDDFCGTGKPVNDTFAIQLNLWNAPNQEVVSRNQSESKVVFTNPANGASVIVHNAYSFSDTFLSGDPNGLNTHEWTFTGNAELIRAADGGVFGHDRGVLVVDTTWNGPEFSGDFVGAEIVSDRGGHALFGNDCGVLVPALGLA
jgi:type 1 fimbria pilin